MEVHRFTAHTGQALEIDVCYACQGLWLDHSENLQLPPAAVVELFRLLHAHRSDQRHPLQARMDCPRCSRTLAQGFDVVRTGRYMTYRCASRHGRFSTFSSFMVEKGFVRHMTPIEVQDLAQRVGAVYCTSCGAPVDIRKDHACPYCVPLSRCSTRTRCARPSTATPGPTAPAPRCPPPWTLPTR